MFSPAFTELGPSFSALKSALLSRFTHRFFAWTNRRSKYISLRSIVLSGMGCAPSMDALCFATTWRVVSVIVGGMPDRGKDVLNVKFLMHPFVVQFTAVGVRYVWSWMTCQLASDPSSVVCLCPFWSHRAMTRPPAKAFWQAAYSTREEKEIGRA